MSEDVKFTKDEVEYLKRLVQEEVRRQMPASSLRYAPYHVSEGRCQVCLIERGALMGYVCPNLRCPTQPKVT